MPNRPFQDEGVVRTDEQAGQPDAELKRVEREYDPAHPPVEGNDPRDTKGAGEPAKVRHEQSQLRTDEQTDKGGIGADIPRSDPVDT